MGDGETIGLAEKFVQGRVSGIEDVSNLGRVAKLLKSDLQSIGCGVVPVTKTSREE